MPPENLDTAISACCRSENADIRHLALSHALRKDLIEEAVNRLALPGGSRGVDMGCGIGLPALTAAQLRPDLDITGVDISSEYIETAKALAVGTDVHFIQGDILAPALPDRSCDWILSIDCLNYAPGLGADALAQVRPLLKKGGKIALMAWTSQQLLPGYPLIEAKLNTTRQAIAPFTPGMDPERHFSRTAALLEGIGFSRIRSQVLVRNIAGPLAPELALGLEDLIRMRWPKADAVPEHLLSAQELSAFQRITDPASQACILTAPHYQGYFTYTLFTAMN